MGGGRQWPDVIFSGSTWPGISPRRRKPYGRVCVGTCCPWGRPGASASFTFRRRRLLPRNQKKSKQPGRGPSSDCALAPSQTSCPVFTASISPRGERTAQLFLPARHHPRQVYSAPLLPPNAPVPRQTKSKSVAGRGWKEMARANWSDRALEGETV